MSKIMLWEIRKKIQNYYLYIIICFAILVVSFIAPGNGNNISGMFAVISSIYIMFFYVCCLIYVMVDPITELRNTQSIMERLSTVSFEKRLISKLLTNYVFIMLVFGLNRFLAPRLNQLQREWNMDISFESDEFLLDMAYFSILLPLIIFFFYLLFKSFHQTRRWAVILTVVVIVTLFKGMEWLYTNVRLVYEILNKSIWINVGFAVILLCVLFTGCCKLYKTKYEE